MARKSNGGVNKSQAIRDIFAKNPDIKVKDVVAEMKSQGVTVAPNLVYLIKGKLKGEKTRRKRVNGNAAKAASASGSGDAVATILKVKKLATDIGGLRALKAVVDALSE